MGTDSFQDCSFFFFYCIRRQFLILLFGVDHQFHPSVAAAGICFVFFVYRMFVWISNVWVFCFVIHSASISETRWNAWTHHIMWRTLGFDKPIVCTDLLSLPSLTSGLFVNIWPLDRCAIVHGTFHSNCVAGRLAGQNTYTQSTKLHVVTERERERKIQTRLRNASHVIHLIGNFLIALSLFLSIIFHYMVFVHRSGSRTGPPPSQHIYTGLWPLKILRHASTTIRARINFRSAMQYGSVLLLLCAAM